MGIKRAQELRSAVVKAVADAKLTDLHTHLYPPSFGDLLLCGVDELVTYHYLIAEVFRWIDLPYDEFWTMSKQAQADLVWEKLFLGTSPFAESCRGVLTTLNRLGLDVAARDLSAYRSYCASMSREEYVDRIFEVSGVTDVIMTNDPFDDAERQVWLDGYEPDPRFKAALRVDALLNTWGESWPRLKEWGYAVTEDLTESTLKEVRRFLTDWAARMEALYLAVSLPPTFAFPEDSPRGILIEKCVLPVCRETNRPFAMMIGVKKLVNPGLRLAGDSVGKGDIVAVENLCAGYPRNKFMVTMLSRENQHELCVAARKFRNLLVFGCWWFLNDPSLVQEITRMRFELLGVSVVPQHSDARVLDQLVYKWDHSRKIIADVLCEKYQDLMATGWVIEEAEIERDAQRLFGGNFWAFLEKSL